MQDSNDSQLKAILKMPLCQFVCLFAYLSACLSAYPFNQLLNVYLTLKCTETRAIMEYNETLIRTLSNILLINEFSRLAPMRIVKTHCKQLVVVYTVQNYSNSFQKSCKPSTITQKFDLLHFKQFCFSTSENCLNFNFSKLERQQMKEWTV